MPTAFASHLGARSARCRRLGIWLLALLAASGCSSKAKKKAPSVSEPPILHIVHPEIRKISRTVGQPSFVQSYERTSIYPKITAFIDRWNVDIGDKVQKGDVLADLFVPELREEWESRKATVKLDKERVNLAEKMVKVAEADVKAADARLIEAKRILGAYKAKVDRWVSEVNRLEREVEKRVVAPQILLESQKQLKADTASWEAAMATVVKAEAEVLSRQAALEAAIVDVKVARARVVVAESEAKKYEAWVGYLKLLAPYDGIVVARNANSWDFLLPNMGDPTAQMRSPDLAPGNKAAPIYVIDRTDIIRIYVDIPERDATYVHVGSDARVKIWAYKDEWIPATVARVAWALNTQSRTMRAEIDLPNYEQRIRPGMYAYGKVVIERPGVLALPKAAITHAGGKSFMWRYVEGKAVRTEIQTGVTAGDWVEVTNRHIKGRSADEEHWEPIDSNDQVLFGPKLSTLTEDTPVELAATPASIEEASKRETPNEAGSR